MSEAAESFIDKQLRGEAAYRLLPLFARGLGQDWLPAWVALLGEIDETAFERSDLRVAQTKLAWWAQDLAAGRQAQHPLSRALLGLPQAASMAAERWQRLVGAALELSQQEASPADWPSAQARWRPLAEAVAAVESELLAAPVDPVSVLLQWQRQRLWRAALGSRPESGLGPLGWQVDLGAPAAAEAWQGFVGASDELLAAEAAARLPLHRALLRSLWHWRLQGLCRGAPPAELLAPSPPRLLWRSWRAAVKVSRS